MKSVEESFAQVKELLYGAGNEVPLDDNELMSVLMTYPACLVAAADGVVDETERLFLLNVLTLCFHIMYEDKGFKQND